MDARRTGLVTLALGLVALLLSAAGVAQARTAPLGLRAGSDPAWRLEGLATRSMGWGALSPGSARTGDLTVTNRTGAAVEVVLRALEVTDDELGCLPQEELSGLEDCGDPAGELGDQLQVVLSAGGTELFAGALRGLTDGTAALTVPADDEAVVTARVWLPHASTNETMTDRVTFDLRAEAVAATGAATGELVSPPVTTEVGAGGAGPADGSGASAAPGVAGSGLLPATGAATLVQLAAVVGACLLSCGGLILRSARSRTRRAPVPLPLPR